MSSVLYWTCPSKGASTMCGRLMPTMFRPSPGRAFIWFHMTAPPTPGLYWMMVSIAGHFFFSTNCWCLAEMSDSPPAGNACQYIKFFSGQVCANAAGAAAKASTASSLFMVGLSFRIAAKCTRKPRPSGARSGGLPCERKSDARDEAAALAREQLEAAAVRAHHALDDGEAQARAALVAARDLEAREWLLQPLHLGLGNSRAAVRDLEHRRAVLGAHRDAHLPFPVAQRVVDQVQHDAPHRHQLQRYLGHVRKIGRDRFAAAAVMLGDLGRDRGEIGALHGLAAVGPRKIEKLVDGAVHLLDVGGHSLPELRVGPAHLQAEPEPRERRTQVVGDAGENQGAVGVQASEVLRHLVEGMRQGAQLLGAGLGDRLGYFSLADRAGARGERAQGAVEPGHDEVRGEQRQRQGERPPAEPAQRDLPLDALAGNAEPILVVVDVETQPQAGLAVALAGEARALAELLPRQLERQVQHGPVGRRREALAGLGGVHLYAFALGELGEQLAAQLGLGIDERGAGDVDDADEVLRDLARARLDLGGAEDLEPRGRGRHDQDCEQDEGAPKQRARPQNHGAHYCGRPSGTNT